MPPPHQQPSLTINGSALSDDLMTTKQTNHGAGVVIAQRQLLSKLSLAQGQEYGPCR